jgi:hypothetical protein
MRLIASSSLLLIVITASAAAPAEAYPYLRFPVRAERNFALSLTGDGVFTDSSGLPLPGIQATLNLGPHFALEAKVSAFYLNRTRPEGLTLASAGIKGYLLRGALSPYAYARGGVAHMTYNFFSSERTDYLAGLLDTGGGIELASRGGFILFVEAGPTFVFGPGNSTSREVAILGRGAVGVGYRF